MGGQKHRDPRASLNFAELMNGAMSGWSGLNEFMVSSEMCFSSPPMGMLLSEELLWGIEAETWTCSAGIGCFPYKTKS
jgi:hypothetical protein